VGVGRTAMTTEVRSGAVGHGPGASRAGARIMRGYPTEAMMRTRTMRIGTTCAEIHARTCRLTMDYGRYVCRIGLDTT
jgi:hypothetical protein